MLTIFFLIVALLSTWFVKVLFEDGIGSAIEEIKYDRLSLLATIIAFYLFFASWYYFGWSTNLWWTISHGVNTLSIM